ncbi:hypothetical protein BC629DRAFT_1263906, partial [Irpex lacteus]
PEWWKSAMTYLKSVSDDERWQSLCSVWLEHEKRLGFPDGGQPNRVSITGRPKEIKWWLDRGRKYEKTPEIDDAAQYGEAWKSWWQQLQPEWRGTTWPPSQVLAAEPSSDWATLNRGGCNGVFMVVLSLGWW